MTVYYGISLIIVVASLCIAVLARLVTRGYLGEIESILDKRRQKKAATIVSVIKETVPYMERFITVAKEARKMDDELGTKGSKYAGKAFDSTIDEMLKNNDLK